MMEEEEYSRLRQGCGRPGETGDTMKKARNARKAGKAEAVTCYPLCG